MRNIFGRVGVFTALMVVLWAYNLQAECNFELLDPIAFAHKGIRVGDAETNQVDNVIQGCVSKEQLTALLNTNISNPKIDDSAFYFLSGKDEKRIKIKNCNEYIAAIKNGMTAKTEVDTTNEIAFHKTCGVLSALSGSIPYKHDYIKDRNHLSEGALSVIFLHAPEEFGIPYKTLLTEGEKEMNFDEYLKSPEGKFKLIEKKFDTPVRLYLETWYGGSEEDESGFWLELHIIAKGDFNKDGYADYLIYFHKVANRGKWFEPGFALLSSKDQSQKLYEVYSRDFTCVYKNKKYVCSNPDKFLPSWSTIE